MRKLANPFQPPFQHQVMVQLARTITSATQAANAQIAKPVISLKSLTAKRQQQPLWPAINFELGAGELAVISGPTGCGKSTLLQIMADLIEPSSGMVIAPEQVALILQNPSIQVIREQLGPEVALALEARGIDSQQMPKLARRALEQVGLDYPLEHGTHALSHGQQYRLLIAAQLVVSPQLLLLDEPWAQLDDVGFCQLLQLIEQLRQQGMAVVICEHWSSPYANIDHKSYRLDPLGLRLTQDANALPMAASMPLELATPRVTAKMVMSLNEPLLTLGEHKQLQCRQLRAYQGEFVVITGANGSGKSSLLNAIAGITPWQQGNSDAQSLHLVWQEPSRQLCCHSVAAELQLGLTRLDLTETERQRRLNDTLAELGLTDIAERSPMTLSYGQQHLTAIASQLCLHPELLLLDDPFAGLDPLSQQRLLLALKQRCEAGSCIVMTSHRPFLGAHRQWRIENGGLDEH